MYVQSENEGDRTRHYEIHWRLDWNEKYVTCTNIMNQENEPRLGEDRGKAKKIQDIEYIEAGAEPT